MGMFLCRVDYGVGVTVGSVVWVGSAVAVGAGEVGVKAVPDTLITMDTL